MTGLRRAIRITIGLVVGLVLIVAVTVAGSALWLNTASGQSWLARTLSDQLSTPGADVITIERIEGPFPSTIRVTGFTLADPGGPWLQIQTVDLEWRPFELLQGRLEISNVAVTNLDLERLPESAPESADQEPFSLQDLSLPELPFEIVVEQLSVEDVRLAPPILGTAASFRVNGHARTRNDDEVELALKIARTDGVAGDVDLQARFHDSEQNLSLTASVREPAGGLIARSLDLPDLPAIDLTLTGDGALSDWSGHLSASADGLAKIDTDLGIIIEPTPTFTIEGQAVPGDLPDEPPWPLLAGPLHFAVKAAWREDEILDLQSLALENETLAVEAHGTLEIASLVLDANAKIQTKDPAELNAIIAPAEVSAVSVAATAKGPLLQPSLVAEVSADAPKSPDITASQVSLRATFEPDAPIADGGLRGSFKATGAVENLTVEPADQIAPLLGSQVILTLEGEIDLAADRLKVDRLAVEAGPTKVTAEGTLQLASGDAKISAEASLSALSALVPLTGLQMSGAANVQAEIDATGYGRSLVASAKGGLKDLALDEPLLETLLGAAPTVDLDLTLAPDRSLTVSTARVEGAAVWLQADGTVAADFTEIDAKLSAGLDRLGVLEPALGTALAGSVTVDVTAAGKTEDPNLTGTLAAKALRVDAIDLGQLDLDFAAEAVATAPRGDIKFTLAAPAGRLTGQSDLALIDDVLEVSGLTLRAQDAQVEGQITVPLSGAPMSGELSARINSLKPLLAVAQVDADGAARADVQLSARDGRQAVAATAEVRSLVYNLGNGDALRAEAANLAVESRDLANPVDSSITAKVADLTVGDIQVSSLDLEGRGGPSGGDFALVAKGQFNGDLALDASGAVAVEGDRLTVELARLQGTLLGKPLALAAPARFAQAGDTYEVGALDLTFAGAQVQAQGRIGADSLNATVELDHVSLALAELASPDLAMTGTLTARLQVEGSRTAPIGTANLTVAGLRFTDDDALPSLDGALEADWRGGRLGVSAEFSGFAEESARLSADLPLRLDPASLSPSIPSQERLSANLDWRGNLKEFWPLVPLVGHSLSGETQLAVDVTGTIAAPRPSGSLTVTGGEYENLIVGTLLKDLNLRLDFQEGRAVLQELSANDGDNGTISAAGAVQIDPDQSFPFDMTTQFQDFTLVRRDDVTAVAKGDLSLGGSLREAALKGTVTSERVDVRISSKLPPQVVDLKVEEVNLPAIGRKPASQTASDGPGLELLLDLLVDLPNKIYVEGLGLESEWGGQLRISGTAAQPVINGQLEIIRGRLTLIGRPFNFTKGQVEFDGGKEIDPILDIEASSDRGELTVTALVTGRANTPDFELTSVPPLPEDEIISQALFGKSSGQLTAFEAVELARTVAEFSGRGSGGGVLNFARDVIGVDVLRIEGGDDAAGSPTVSAGKYIGDSVYVGVKQGAAAQSGSVGVEVELTPNISVTSDVGEGGESDIGIEFKWDY